jgi:hypothetical protein
MDQERIWLWYSIFHPDVRVGFVQIMLQQIVFFGWQTMGLLHGIHPVLSQQFVNIRMNCMIAVKVEQLSEECLS